jgi:four helix bundle protein
MKIYLDYEKLIVYQKTIKFITWVHELLEKIQYRAAVKDQLDRASTSIALNLAEGNGKFSIKEGSYSIE